MNLQSKIIVSMLILGLIIWMLRNLVHRRLTTGQVLFWLLLLSGAEVLAIFPRLVDHASVFWGNLIPISWISFVGLLSLIVYLLNISIKMNDQRAKIVQLTRSLCFFQKEINDKIAGAPPAETKRPD